MDGLGSDVTSSGVETLDAKYQVDCTKLETRNLKPETIKWLKN
jgi:hypothetical protein